VPDKQRPERDANCPEQQTEWKKNPKWLRETKREKFIRLHDPVGKDRQLIFVPEMDNPAPDLAFDA
jgi:hypothetical protein